eukprot:scaffold211776_cov26-Tisochrysis_lutea.AAC.1
MWHAQITVGRSEGASARPAFRLSKITWTSSSSSTVRPMPRKKHSAVRPVAAASLIPAARISMWLLGKISVKET